MICTNFEFRLLGRIVSPLREICPDLTGPCLGHGLAMAWSEPGHGCPWLGHGRAVPATGCPLRWALPCHFPDCSHDRVLLPESFRGVAPSVDPELPALMSIWQGGRSPLSCIEQENASAVHSSAQANDYMLFYEAYSNFLR